MPQAPAQSTRSKLQRAIDRETSAMAKELQDCPKDFDRFNTGMIDEASPDAHIPLPDVAIWEDRKLEYHKVYMSELSKKMGVELPWNYSQQDMLRLSRSNRKQITKAHHDKIQLCSKRLDGAMEDMLSRVFNDGRRFRRHPVAGGWEKLSCFVGADEYLFFKLPGALEGRADPSCRDFWGFYVICHSDAEHMDGHHVLMTGMANRIMTVRYTRLCYCVAAFRVDLDLAEMLMQRVKQLEAQLKVPQGQTRHLELELKASDMMSGMQEAIDSMGAEKDMSMLHLRDTLAWEKMGQLAQSLGSFIRELNQRLTDLKPK